jgi:hypothetical protein
VVVDDGVQQANGPDAPRVQSRPHPRS